MFAWGDDVERSSYEDSEAFEEDSNCSWFSEPESVLNNWRGWRKQSTSQPPPPPSTLGLVTPALGLGTAGGGAGGAHHHGSSSVGTVTAGATLGGYGRDLGPVSLPPAFHRGTSGYGTPILSLTELSAREVASSIPFELVEVYHPPVPEQLQLRIAFWSFPDQEEDIRLYSCLANGNSDEFQKGENLFKTRSVKDPLQIGFHLSATIEPSTGKASQNTSVTFDRKKIVSCQCSCNSAAQWCSHVVALALHRIHQFPSVRLRAPVSESLSRLERDQLRKFAQYLIAKLPEQILPVAQNILDDLLSQAQTDINTVQGAPDPTLGGATGEQAAWCLDAKNLKDNIKKILIKFCVPAPIVFSDVNCLSNSAPPSASEWCSYLRPLRGREPEGMWNLLSIVREMYRRNDRNGIPLLEIVTTQCLETAQIMVWWFNMKVALQQKSHGKHNVNSNSQVSQNACSSLCDEIVTLWKLAALNPCISPMEREILRKRLIQYHLTVVEKVRANQSTSTTSNGGGGGPPRHTNNNGVASGGGSQSSKRPSDIELFPGFKPAIEACSLNWDEYSIPGVTYGLNAHYLSPFAVFKLKQDEGEGEGQVNSSQAVLRCEYPSRPRSGPQPLPPENNPLNSEENVSDEGVVNDPPLFPLPSSSSAEDFDKTEGARDSSGNESSPEREDGPKGLKLVPGSPDEEDKEEEGAENASHSMHNNTSNDNNNSDNHHHHHQLHLQQQPNSSNNSHNHQENEQYQVYFYDPKLPVKMISSAPGAADQAGTHPNGTPLSPVVDVFRNLRPKIEDPWEVLYMRAEGIHAHGYQSEACKMAVHLAHDLLKHPPDLLLESNALSNHHNNNNNKNNTTNNNNKNNNNNNASHSSTPNASSSASLSVSSTPTTASSVTSTVGSGMAPSTTNTGNNNNGSNCPGISNPPSSNTGTVPKPKGKNRKRVSAGSHQITHTASTTLAHCAFLCTVLAENTQYYHLAFQIGLFGLEMARPPATTKPMEVKLAHQESELVNLLKKIPLGRGEMGIIRERAYQLKEGILRNRGEALLPLMLASYIFESLVVNAERPDEQDENLGFEASVAAIGLKANICEADHPLLCEGTRRQRGDLAILLLTHYKDDPTRLAQIMEQLLDKEMNPLFKSPIIPAAYYINGRSVNNGQQPTQPPARSLVDQLAQMALAVPPTVNRRRSVQHPEAQRNPGVNPAPHLPPANGGFESWASWENNLQANQERLGEWSHPAGAVGSSPSGARALEPSSSENSVARGPALRLHHHRAGPGSESSSSGNSSADSIDSSGSSFRQPPMTSQPPHALANKLGAGNKNAPLMGAAPGSVDNVCGNGLPLPQPPPPAGLSGSASAPLIQGTPRPPLLSVSSANNVLTPSSSSNGLVMQPQVNMNRNGGMSKGSRFKGKRAYPSIPNQPSEASAHFMFELAKTVLNKAGGTSTTSLFTQANQNIRGPHKALHMCAFQIGLFALGLSNMVTANWLSRTYSGNVSWITSQALELGCSALNFLMNTWEGHFSPTEVASLADKASKSRDNTMVRAGAELALSVCHHAGALNPTETQRAIEQCNEQSVQMLEKACLAVEKASASGGVPPEVIFEVARHWFRLYDKQAPGNDEGEGQQHQQPVIMSQQQQQETLVAANLIQSLNHAAAFPQMSMAPPSLQVSLPFPIYSLVPGFPSNQNPQSQFMFVAPPPQNNGAVGLQLQAAGLAAQANGAQYLANQVYPPVSGVSNQQRFNLTGGPIFQLGLAAAPLLPNPPPTNHLQAVHAAAAAHQQQAVALLAQAAQPPPVQAPMVQHPNQGGQAQGNGTAPGANGQRYLFATYRVGMLALEHLGRKISEERPQLKFAKNPSYEEDVKWLLQIAKKLGLPYLEKFLVFVISTILSPFLLHDLLWECAKILAQNGFHQNNIQYSTVIHHIQTQPHLSQLLTRCCNMYYQCLHLRLFHVAPADYDDFVKSLLRAKQAFSWIADGGNAYNSLLQSIRRSKTCKRELWHKISDAQNQQSGLEPPM
ncbi:zinc finger SWIM domain-containing protein 8-like [Tigriopus californicus]|uniref:zinc finger SWIM domain-containing protein 8-like n=1 Tax=Tigriopus californicus TaxID=6832 RepID=UPI0027DA6EC6|nr:zinc finger SWIM domain-containing protein 8-like [Tigriopus californicus]|eukprot:TCALIF_07786-PA protein Name:"Similar to ZSWIM8 Zinc finger SWIM domain-containing protein 8 (Homo sapiens)" AED:0.03 eAED:0.03 QI:290/1/1/1/0.85/0.86/15/390/2002